MFNHMSYKVMLWGTGEKQSFYFSTLKDAAEKFISLAEEYQAKPDDFPGSPHGELWYSWMPGKTEGEIILCREYNEDSIDWKNNTCNPPFDVLPVFRSESEELSKMFPNFRFTIWDEIEGDRALRSETIEKTQSFLKMISDDTISNVEFLHQMYEFVHGLKNKLDESQF